MKTAYSIFCVVIIGGLCLLFISMNRKPVCGVKDYEPPILICGTSLKTPKLTEKGKLGKQLFKANCAACHKVNTFFTAPPLKSSTENYTIEDIIKFIRKDSTSSIKSDNKRGLVCISFPNITDDQIKYIIEYINAH